MDSGEVFVYCYMSGHDLGECGDGGWTLVMKIDGKKVYLVIKYVFIVHRGVR